MQSPDGNLAKHALCSERTLSLGLFGARGAIRPTCHGDVGPVRRPDRSGSERWGRSRRHPLGICWYRAAKRFPFCLSTSVQDLGSIERQDNPMISVPGKSEVSQGYGTGTERLGIKIRPGRPECAPQRPAMLQRISYWPARSYPVQFQSHEWVPTFCLEV